MIIFHTFLFHALVAFKVWGKLAFIDCIFFRMASMAVLECQPQVWREVLLSASFRRLLLREAFSTHLSSLSVLAKGRRFSGFLCILSSLRQLLNASSLRRGLYKGGQTRMRWDLKSTFLSTQMQMASVLQSCGKTCPRTYGIPLI